MLLIYFFVYQLNAKAENYSGAVHLYVNSHTHHHKCSNTVSYIRAYMSDKQWALNKQNIFSSLFTCTAHSAYNLKYIYIYMCSYA